MNGRYEAVTRCTNLHHLGQLKMPHFHFLNFTFTFPLWMGATRLRPDAPIAQTCIIWNKLQMPHFHFSNFTFTFSFPLWMGASRLWPDAPIARTCSNWHKRKILHFPFHFNRFTFHFFAYSYSKYSQEPSNFHSIRFTFPFLKNYFQKAFPSNTPKIISENCICNWDQELTGAWSWCFRWKCIKSWWGEKTLYLWISQFQLSILCGWWKAPLSSLSPPQSQLNSQ